MDTQRSTTATTMQPPPRKVRPPPGAGGPCRRGRGAAEGGSGALGLGSGGMRGSEAAGRGAQGGLCAGGGCGGVGEGPRVLGREWGVHGQPGAGGALARLALQGGSWGDAGGCRGLRTVGCDGVGGRTGQGWGRAGEDGGAGGQRSGRDPPLHRGLSEGTRSAGRGAVAAEGSAARRGGGRAACGVLPREFRGLPRRVGGSSEGLVVLGKKVTSGVDPGTQPVPACARSAHRSRGSGNCAAFSHSFVPTCDGDELQMRRGGSAGDPALRGHVGRCPPRGMEIRDKRRAPRGLSGEAGWYVRELLRGGFWARFGVCAEDGEAAPVRAGVPWG